MVDKNCGRSDSRPSGLAPTRPLHGRVFGLDRRRIALHETYRDDVAAAQLPAHLPTIEQIWRGTRSVTVDGRVRIEAAIGSNELYPRRPGRVRRRAASFMSPETAPYLIFGERRLFTLIADDVTAGRHEVNYQLEFLPPSDAFYTFRGWLGARRRLPGRDGPPGADFNTLPRFKPKASQLVVSYWYENDRFFADRIGDLFGDPQTYAETLADLQSRL